MKAKQKLLLLKDIEDLGRSGEVVSVKAGYARNYLLPKLFGITADANTLRMQEKLQKERAVESAVDKKEAAALAKIIETMTLSIKVKVDYDGRMYGSVSATDITHLFEQHNIKLTKKNIGIKKSIKETGDIEVPIKLKEDVETKVILKIIPEEMKLPKDDQKKKEEQIVEEGEEEIIEDKKTEKKQTKKSKEKKEEK